MKKAPANGDASTRSRRRSVPREIPLPIDPDETAKLAYFFWQARAGNDGGSPEDDWYRAEQELRTGKGH